MKAVLTVGASIRVFLVGGVIGTVIHGTLTEVNQFGLGMLGLAGNYQEGIFIPWGQIECVIPN